METMMKIMVELMKGQINELRQIMEATKKKSTEPDCTNGK